MPDPGDFSRGWYPYVVPTGRFRTESPTPKLETPALRAGFRPIAGGRSGPFSDLALEWIVDDPI